MRCRKVIAAFVLTAGLGATACSAETAGPAKTNYHVVVTVNGSAGVKWVEWSATAEPSGSAEPVVAPLDRWTLEYRWELNSSRKVRVTANHRSGGWVACSITVNDVLTVTQRDDSPSGDVTCVTEVGSNEKQAGHP